MKTTQRILGITCAALLSAAGSFAQTAPTTPVTATKPTTPVTTTTPTAPVTPVATVTPGRPAVIPNEHASDTAKAVHAVLAQFEAKRDQAMADRKALIDKLQAAKTDAERQAIIAQLRTETKAEKDQQSALGKEIRDELKKLREQRKTGGG